MNPQFRDRVLLPIAVILAAFVLIEILAFSLSRVFLAVSHDLGHNQTAVLALAVAIGVLVLCALVAARPRISSGTLTALCVVGFLAVVGAGVAMMGKADAPGGGHGPAAEHGSSENLDEVQPQVSSPAAH
ncbi:MAG TPA: hypothetical protein VM840_10365 [Actinomycetota bacterium]|nr:hypothetical protein [Actinomycetota bacterium]